MDLGKFKANLETVTGGMAAAGLDKVKAALTEIASYSASFANAGWSLLEMKVEIGIAPKVTARLKASGEPSEDKLQLIIKENPDKKMLEALVTALIQANKLRSSVETGALKLDEVEVGTEMGAIPKVVLNFK